MAKSPAELLNFNLYHRRRNVGGCPLGFRHFESFVTIVTCGFIIAGVIRHW